jgi:hypothetical protein
LLLPLEEERCACATARYAASQAVASLEGASALLLRLCVALRPARHAAHSPQVVVLGEEGSSCCSCRSRRRGARVRQHGTRPLRQWHRRDERVHCCYDCVRLCGLHGTQRTHHRWWCLGRRARAVALGLEEGRCACAKARYAASQAVASLGEASALLLRLCVALRPAQHAERSLKTGGRSERSRLLVGGLGGAASGAVCRSRGLVGATSGVVATGHGTGGRNDHLPVKGLVGASSGVVCWSWDWWAHRAESYASRGTGGRNERSRLLVMGLVGAASGVVCWSWDWWAHRAESSAGHGTGRRSERSRLLVMGLVGASSGVVCWSWDW